MYSIVYKGKENLLKGDKRKRISDCRMSTQAIWIIALPISTEFIPPSIILYALYLYCGTEVCLDTHRLNVSHTNTILTLIPRLE